MPVITSTPEEEAAFAEGNPLPDFRPFAALPAPAMPTVPTMPADVAAWFPQTQPADVYRYGYTAACFVNGVFVETSEFEAGTIATHEEAFAAVVDTARTLNQSVMCVSIFLIRHESQYNTRMSRVIGSMGFGKWNAHKPEDMPHRAQ